GASMAVLVMKDAGCRWRKTVDEHWSKRNRCGADLLCDVRAHQRTPTKGATAESACGGITGHGADGCTRSITSGASLSCRRLRHAGLAAGHDDHLRLPLPGRLFRLGVRLDSSPSQNAPIASGLPDLHLGPFVGAAGQ